MLGQNARRPLSWWLSAAAVIAISTSCAMWKEVGAVGVALHSNGFDFAGADFAGTTWHAIRGLLAGQDVYTTSTRIAGVGVTWPAGEHVPATLTWQAPFAALPLWAGFFAFDITSIAAVWAAVFILTRPRSPQAVLVAACCGSFAILGGAGLWTLLTGQPPGFELLGIAVLVRARKPWVAAVGFVLAASNFQTGVPLAIALIVLQAWPVVWRGTVLTTALSLPPVALGVRAAGGVMPYARVFVRGALGHLATLPGEPRGLADHPSRVDLGGLLYRAGIESTGLQMAAGLLALVLCLVFLARLPTGLRRLDDPPILCLVVGATILCAYHQPYDMLLVAGAVIPVVLLVADRSGLMLGVFAVAGIGVAMSINGPVAAIVDPVCLIVMTVLSALAARQAERPAAANSPDPTGSALISTNGTVSGELAS